MSRPFRAPYEPQVVPPWYPPKPVPNKPPRRRLLAALGTLAAVPGIAQAAPLPDPDGALIETCALAIQAQAECEACYCYPLHLTAEEAKPYEDRADQFADVAFAHAETALDLQAITLAGIAAKARAARALAAKRADGNLITNGTPEDLAWSALEDLLRLQ